MDDISFRNSRVNTNTYSPELKNINKITNTLASENLR